MQRKLIVVAIAILILAGIFKIFFTEGIFTREEKIVRTEDKSEMFRHLQAKIYVKSSCFYCQRAVALLEEKQIKYELVELTDDRELQLKLIEQTSQTTVPYIFLNKQFIGGFNELNNISWKELENNLN